jgi:hypothetical protein
VASPGCVSGLVVLSFHALASKVSSMLKLILRYLDPSDWGWDTILQAMSALAAGELSPPTGDYWQGLDDWFRSSVW